MARGVGFQKSIVDFLRLLIAINETPETDLVADFRVMPANDTLLC